MRSFLSGQFYQILGAAVVSILGAVLSLLPGEVNELPERPAAPTPTRATIAQVPTVDGPGGVPTATSTPVPVAASTGNRGSLIVLQTSSGDDDDWVTMDWLAGDGNWYEVDGWRGHIHHGQVIWWVAPENLGDGMYRWVVYDDESKETLHKMSEPFMLPEQERIVVVYPLDWE